MARDTDHYLVREPGARLWAPPTFLSLADGSRHLFFGGRGNTRSPVTERPRSTTSSSPGPDDRHAGHAALVEFGQGVGRLGQADTAPDKCGRVESA